MKCRNTGHSEYIGKNKEFPCMIGELYLEPQHIQCYSFSGYLWREFVLNSHLKQTVPICDRTHFNEYYIRSRRQIV